MILSDDVGQNSRHSIRLLHAVISLLRWFVVLLPIWHVFNFLLISVLLLSPNFQILRCDVNISHIDAVTTHNSWLNVERNVPTSVEVLLSIMFYNCNVFSVHCNVFNEHCNVFFPHNCVIVYSINCFWVLYNAQPVTIRFVFIRVDFNEVFEGWLNALYTFYAYLVYLLLKKCVLLWKG